jgi:hypothetical protein
MAEAGGLRLDLVVELVVQEAEEGVVRVPRRLEMRQLHWEVVVAVVVEALAQVEMGPPVE